MKYIDIEYIRCIDMYKNILLYIYIYIYIYYIYIYISMAPIVSSVHYIFE